MRKPNKEAKIRQLNKERCRINGMLDEIMMSVKIFREKMKKEQDSDKDPSEELIQQAADLSQKFDKSLSRYGRRLERIKTELGELTNNDVSEL